LCAVFDTCVTERQSHLHTLTYSHMFTITNAHISIRIHHHKPTDSQTHTHIHIHQHILQRTHTHTTTHIHPHKLTSKLSSTRIHTTHTYKYQCFLCTTPLFGAPHRFSAVVHATLALPCIATLSYTFLPLFFFVFDTSILTPICAFRQMERQKIRETGRLTEGQTERQTERQNRETNGRTDGAFKQRNAMQRNAPAIPLHRESVE
jgi:hypothetical protein